MQQESAPEGEILIRGLREERRAAREEIRDRRRRCMVGRGVENPTLPHLALRRRLGKIGFGIQLHPHHLAYRTVGRAGEVSHMRVAGGHARRREEQQPAQKTKG